MNLAFRFFLFIALLVGILFGCAGRLDLPFFWGWLAVPVIAALAALPRMDPDLLKERMHPGQGGTDRNLRFVAIPFWVAHLAVAGLDVGRFYWSSDLPVTLQVVGLVIFAATYALAVWAISVNRFYSSVVRVQSDRGHVVVTTGPYRWIRHPGYAALLVGTPCGGLALGSWWSLVPLVPLLILILRRTIIEDRFLQQNLAGYSTYAQRVRCRLVPGLW
jgi:protein-S-isoprenylcysteine O-methyltransferase Ste14